MGGNPGSVERLLKIMARLRDPNGGCPWDRRQTYATIVPHTLEEAYEVADAIERQDFDDLPDELGDLLFQVVFYAQLGQEEGRFDFGEVVQRICDKLERRHPHVFGAQSDSAFLDEAALTTEWERRKASERAKKARTGILADVPTALPALSRSVKLQKRAARVGFDWDNLAPVAGKISEELDEVLEAVQEDESQQRVQEELGDLLFAVTNLARHLNVDPEQALRLANQKFEHRFNGVEQRCQQAQLPLKEAGMAQLEAFWQEIKRAEKGG
ncbi:nucleoside triphosphate pyrophosphohydrolase [Ferrimonas gelatinilytica]|uniref:Nucleoside triphosphate pyrophosphohydrolase n=1 Tax=Ferrimonas gelatinilytica TaxID=1255257 RepID=A0ABP9S961_9GAMM